MRASRAGIAMTVSGRTFDSGCELEIAYHDSRKSLLGFLMGRLRNREAAEDVAQDLFLAIPKVREVSPIRDPKAMLFRIASNLAINKSSQDARRADLLASHADILWTVVDEVTPERALLGREALDTVDAAIDALPERTRQILAWRRIDHLTNREIAARLGISETAVEKHMRKAMFALARALDAGDDG